VIWRGRPGLRRALAAVLVVIGVLAFVAPIRKAVSDTRFVLSEFARYNADVSLARFACVRGQIQAASAVPTYLATGDGVPGLLWYQRGIEFGFDEVPFVEDRRDAEQVLEIEDVPAGTGNCGDVQVTVVSR
jgi:hypothetical protein